jgi:hypothetical protein
MKEEDRIRAFLYPEEVEKKKEVQSPAEDENEAITKIEKEIHDKIEFEIENAYYKDAMHEEYEEKYKPVLGTSVFLDSLILFVLLTVTWYIVIVVFEGTFWNWLICPLLAIGAVYQSQYIFLMRVPPDRAARKAVLNSSSLALALALLYELVKYMIKMINA